MHLHTINVVHIETLCRDLLLKSCGDHGEQEIGTLSSPARTTVYPSNEFTMYNKMVTIVDDDDFNMGDVVRVLSGECSQRR